MKTASGMITLESSPAVTFAANEEEEVEEERDQKFQGPDLGELERVLLQLHSRGDTWEAAWGVRMMLSGNTSQRNTEPDQTHCW